jgi:hypothetical protein
MKLRAKSTIENPDPKNTTLIIFLLIFHQTYIRDLKMM